MRSRGTWMGTHQIQPESQWESPEHLPNESIIWALIIAYLIGDVSDPPSGICWEGRRQGKERREWFQGNDLGATYCVWIFPLAS